MHYDFESLKARYEPFAARGWQVELEPRRRGLSWRCLVLVTCHADLYADAWYFWTARNYESRSQAKVGGFLSSLHWLEANS